ncbi:hypothetical protein ACFQX6_13290 [Streptosporangium lutulentum]
MAQEFLRAGRAGERRRIRVRRGVVTGLVALLVTSLVAAGLAFASALTITNERNIALSKQWASDSERFLHSAPESSRRLAVMAARIAATDEAEHALLNVISYPGLRTVSTRLSSGFVRYSPDGRKVYIGAYPLPEVRDARTLEVIRRIDALARAWHIVPSDDGRVIAGHDSIGVTVWRDGGTTLSALVPKVTSLDLSRDGTLLVVGDGDGVLHRIDVHSWEAVGPRSPPVCPT